METDYKKAEAKLAVEFVAAVRAIIPERLSDEDRATAIKAVCGHAPSRTSN